MSSGNQYQEDVETLELLNSQKSILLYNDEVNTFDHVIDTLCKYQTTMLFKLNNVLGLYITTENVWLKKSMKNLNRSQCS